MPLYNHEIYMHRCLQLALLGSGQVAPNPMVGAVLVHEGNIIGEGYHEKYGGPHAEVNCFNSVSRENESKIKDSVLYVSLEPCNHHGKTPPCTELIIRKQVRTVVVACSDPFEKVNGSGFRQLQAADIKVITGILESEATSLNKRFFTFHRRQRPYIILKWAQSSDLSIAAADGSPLAISHPLSNRLVHRWRSEEAAILVGTNTALIDNPSLTTRLWPGKNPLRIVIDKVMQLPAHYHLLDQSTPSLIFNQQISKEEKNVVYYKYNGDEYLLDEICSYLYQHGYLSLIVEGGSRLLQSFIQAGLWDEARVITNASLHIPGGIQAPVLSQAQLKRSTRIGTDVISIWLRKPKEETII